MSGLLIAALVMTAAPPKAAVPPAGGRTAQAAARKAGDVEKAPRKTLARWCKDVSDALTREAVAKTETERADAIRALAALYKEGAAAKYLPRSTRAKLRAKMWGRLVRIKKELERKIAREEKKLHAAARYQDDPDSLASQTDAGTAAGHRGGGARQADYGQELVDLIQATISPDTWDVNGGNGSIVYYGNLKVLVVRAPGEVHGDVGAVLEALRRAGP